MTPNAIHECMVPSCGKMISTHLVMCGRHWFQVPVKTRNEVWAAWSQYRAGRIGLDALRAVQQKAADAVEGGAA